MAPALRIPISANLQEFEQGMNKARSTTASGVKFMAQQFVSLNKEIAAGGVTATALGTGVLAAASRMTSGFIASRVAIAAAAIAIGGAIAEARRQLEEMAEVAEKSGKAGTSAEFFQGFLLATRNLKLEAKDLETALTRAFEATKEKIDQTLPLLDRLKEFFLGGLVGGGAQGLDLFRGAQNQDQKVRAILVAMIELEKEGQKLAALDIGEKMFGAAFVDKIRQGKTSAQELLDTIDKAKAGGVAGGEIFSDELVKRADEIDKKLKQAHETLERNLRPAWDGLVDVALAIKSVWAEIVGLVAAAANVAAVFGREAELRQNIQERDQLRSRLADENLQYAAREQILRRIRLLEAKGLSAYDAKTFGSEFSSEPTVGGYGPPPIPLPRENPLKGTFGHQRRFEEKPAVAEESNRLDSEIARTERRIAVQEADARAVGLAAGEKESLRVQSVLLNAAEQAGIDLLDIANPKTIEYISTIERLADASAKAAEKQKLAQESLAAFKSFGSDLSSGFQSAVFEGKKLNDVINSILKSLASRKINKLFDLAANQAFNAFTGPSTSTSGPLVAPEYRASGGPVSAGKAYIVGEKRPELFIPNMSGTIAPNPIRASGSGGGGAPQISFHVENNVSDAEVGRPQMNMDAMGRVIIRMAVNQAKAEINSEIASGQGTANSIAGRFGLNPARGNAR